MTDAINDSTKGRPATVRPPPIDNSLPPIHRVKWRHSNLWLQYDLYVVGQHGVLRQVKWWRFVALFVQNWISWFKKMSASSLSY